MPKPCDEMPYRRRQSMGRRTCWLCRVPPLTVLCRHLLRDQRSAAGSDGRNVQRVIVDKTSLKARCQHSGMELTDNPMAFVERKLLLHAEHRSCYNRVPGKIQRRHETIPATLFSMSIRAVVKGA
ncbi:hypothetical protein KCP73_13330 [Salmonella enterica subsp. enterica]|nr:hypothetical protein KCP73_13330 [Salmonella enterica subsp. enterica]